MCCTFAVQDMTCVRPPCTARPRENCLQHSCSHSTVICNQRFKKRKELRTHDAPLIAEHRGGTNRAWFHHSRTRRICVVPFIVGCSYCTQKNKRFRAPTTSQSQAPATSMQPLQCVSQHPRISLRTWQLNMTTFMQPFHCDLTKPEVQKTD